MEQDVITLINRLGKEKVPFLFIIDFEMKCPVIFPVNTILPNNIIYNIRGINNEFSYKPKELKFFNKKPVDYETYLNAFNNVLKHENFGNSYLVNLTFPSVVETNVDLLDIYYLSHAPYKLFFQNRFVVFSPETFITIQNNEISSHPMKGTIDAGIPDAEKKILGDEKEMAEHATIVDLIRNDISKIAFNVNVVRYRYISHIKTNQKELLQVSSEIRGQLQPDFNTRLGDILYALLPAGSVSGAPKEKTLAIIRESELSERGYYTGIFGYFDGVNLDSAVMIRFIERMNDKLVYRSGGGITAYSNCRDEYNELIDKIYVPVG